MAKNFTYILLSLLSFNCSQSLSIKDVIVTTRSYAPDHAHVALSYYVDHGAMGESDVMTSVVKVNDTFELPTKSRLPCLDLRYNSCYFDDHWLDDNTLQVYLQEVPFVKSGFPFDSTGFNINGVHCKVVPYDNSKGLPPTINYYNYSDDRNKLIVSYDYDDCHNISVINLRDKLPKFGNVFASAGGEFDPFFYAKWQGNELSVYSGDLALYTPSNYLNKKVSYKINFVDIAKLKDLFGSEDIGTRIRTYTNPITDSFLRLKQASVSAVIINVQWPNIDSMHIFTYKYKYEVAGRTFFSQFGVYNELKNGIDYQNGDSVKVLYYPDQPIIHTIERLKPVTEVKLLPGMAKHVAKN